MIKIGTSGGKTLVLLSSVEFTGLSGNTSANIPDNTNISLAPIQTKIDLVNSKAAELLELKVVCAEMIAKLNSIGI
jgi:hypothetical protein